MKGSGDEVPGRVWAAAQREWGAKPLSEQEAIEKIHSVYPTGKKNGLENMRALMEKLGHIQDGLSMVHVAGTNGKGSTCAMLERMLREAGYKTGLYTSPYIEVYNERIRIGGKPVDGETLAALVETVFPAVEMCVAEGYAITEFELGTALAFAAFHREKVDVAIIEVGLGGRLDPTNIITPLVSVITEVGLDHMAYLGDTIEAIAKEKAGIMKPGVPVVLSARDEAALAVLHGEAARLGVEVIQPDAENVREEKDGVVLDMRMGEGVMRGLAVSLAGGHQAENACGALGAVAALGKAGYSVQEEAIRAALVDVHWPGRLERFGHVILDGAHNDPGVRALCAYCDRWLDREKTVLLTCMMEDKETDKMAAMLAQRARCVVATQLALPRAMKADKLADTFAAHDLEVHAKSDVAEALMLARNLAGEEGTVLCSGSLYLIGALRALLRQEKEFAHVI